MKDARYAQWLQIADEFEALDELTYGKAGPLSHVKDVEHRASSGIAVARWIRQKCETGRWYWWDKSTLAGKADWLLLSVNRRVDEAGGRFEATEAGRELIARLPLLKARIDQLARR